MHDTEMAKIHKVQILVGYNEGVSHPLAYVARLCCEST